MAALDFDLRLLVALRALLEEANVTRAGERIHMGQSSMSSALSRLREHFDDELLVRVGRDYELTPLARLLLPQVQRTLTEIERALASDGPFDPATSYRVFTIMASDYAALEFRRLIGPVLRDCPGISFEFSALPTTPTDSEHDLMTHDFVLVVPGIGVEGDSMELFVDRYVCLVDRDNAAVVDGVLSWDDFTSLPHASSDFGKAHLTPAVRRLRELGSNKKPVVKAAGFLPLLPIVAGTDLVALVPSRLADRLGPATGTVGVPTPFGRVDIIETLWWHPSRADDAAHTWLRGVIAGQL